MEEYDIGSIALCYKRPAMGVTRTDPLSSTIPKRQGTKSIPSYRFEFICNE